ncbi:MAG TPA: tripartite tricarboxylate transporter substrate binding protein [Xanthobacteraceae bacterium]|jgi:tripartite-type tricarboxylate transporter receptor subunit TctC|nr:tripartite tricarboxylate transporter substrate binding protein [Xanthobacteraceae bacterium]
MKRAALVGLILLLALFSAPRPQAQTPSQNWPVRPVRVIVPLSAGAATDVTARLYAEGLSARWHQPVVIENRPGPDALNAVNAFVSASDEHTLLFSFGGPVTINPFLHEKLSYDPVRDLVPIVLGSDSFLAIAVNSALNINSLKDLEARAKTEPGKLDWAATPGMPQFGFAEFLKSAGVAMTYLPYREFGPALQDVSEGRIAVVSTGLLPLLSLAQTGKIKVLGVMSRMRSTAAPQVPTAIEAGFPDVIAEGFQGFFGWRDMPDALRDRIAADVRAVAADLPAEKLLGMGQIVRAGTSADFVATIDDQRGRVRAVMDTGLIERR